MKSRHRRAAESPAVRSIGEPRLTAGLESHNRLGLGAHLAVHGPLPGPGAAGLIALAESVDLRGRGGAGFPVARKLRALAKRRREPVVVVNAMEGEPGSAKDALLLTRLPHLVLDGALIAATALGAHETVVGVPAGSAAERSIRQAVRERSAPIRVAGLPERFIAGESRALARGVSGEAALPPADQTLTTLSGVNRRPTLVSNAETFAQLAVLARLGPGAYAAVGTSAEPGTVLLTVGGSAAHPAVVETPTGVPLTEVLDLCAAPIGDGVLVGGYHGKWMTAEQTLSATVSRSGMAMLGAGVVLPLGSGTCPFGEVAAVAAYLGRQSSGQCGSCRVGLPYLARELAGGSPPEALRKLAADVHGACAHPDGTARFVVSALEVFADEFVEHAERGGCGRPTLGVLPVPADQERLHVDWVRCAGHGLCAKLVPELIRLDASGHPVETGLPVPPWLRKKARNAVAMCPALALHLRRE